MKNIGTTGLLPSDLGLGCTGMSDLHAPTDEAESIATIHAALDAGTTFLPTDDDEGRGHNGVLTRRHAPEGRRRDRVILRVKFVTLPLRLTPDDLRSIAEARLSIADASDRYPPTSGHVRSGAERGTTERPAACA